MEENKDFAAEGRLKLLDPQTVTFEFTAGGYLAATVEGTRYERVRLCRALPYGKPNRYICLCDPEEGTEYGMISDLSSFSSEQRALVERELETLYYMPQVLSIRSARMKMGYMEFQIVTELGPKFFRMRDPSRNIRWLSHGTDGRVQLIDCDGNRYLIPDVSALDRKSLSMIDTYLV